MAKHAADQAKGPTKDDKRRQAHIEKAETLSAKAWKYVDESLDAVIPCTYCEVKKNELNQVVVSAPKFDELGLCIKCHGTKVVPDKERREWASKEVLGRVSPAPKSVEVSGDVGGQGNELEKALTGKTDAELQEIAKSFGVV